MRLYLRLLGLQINQRFGLSVLRAGWHENRTKTIAQGALALVVLLSLGVLVGMYAWLLHAIMPAFTSLGFESLVLGLALMVAMLFVFFGGMMYLIGMLFFSKDTEFLASLPIPQQTVFAAKFSQVLIGEIGMSLVLLLPPFIIYGLQTNASIGYWLRTVLVTLTTPCIPLALGALLALLLMRFNALWRNRELMTTIGSIALVVVILIGQFTLTSHLPEDMSPVAIMALITDNEGLLRMVVSAFPPSGWAAQGVLAGGGQLWLFLGVSLLALALVTMLSSRLYYRGASAQLETATSRRAVSLSGKSIRQHGSLRALVSREWRTVLRSPTYALNGLIVIVVGPIMMLLPRFMQGMTGDAELDALFALLGNMVDARLVLLMLAAIFAALGLLNPAVSTTLSREGKLFYLSRMIPVSPARQVIAKFLFGLSVSGLAMVLMAVSAVISLHLPLTLVLWALLLGCVASIAPLALSMLPDILKPKLSWNSETEAIKQNMNAILGMAIGWAYVFLIGLGCVLLIGGGIDLTLLLTLVVAISLVLGIASLWLLSRAARRSWRAIEG